LPVFVNRLNLAREDLYIYMGYGELGGRGIRILGNVN